MSAAPSHIIAGVLLVLAGCGLLEPPTPSSQVVVEAYMVAGEAMSEVRLTRTVPLDAAYDADSLGIVDADARVELLRSDGSIEESYALKHADYRPGIYIPSDRPIIEPRRTYRLIVDAPEASGLITSTTTVPDTFRTLRANRDTVVYRSDDPFVFYLSPPSSSGRQNVFVITTVALDGHEEELTPFARARFEDGGATITQLRENVSPLLNEESFSRTGEGELRVQYPWLGINFYGRTRVVLQALDENLYDFLRSHMVQQGGSTLPPGEIPNVLEHVDGARGIFGSLARAEVDFVVLREGN